MTRIAIVGATGAVGREILDVLERREIGTAEVRLLASERSAGRTMELRGRALEVQPLRADAFSGVDIALFAANGDVARTWAPRAVESGAVVIDNSSAFRLEPDVPLVVPECNAETIANRPRGIIANPNCSTILLAVALAPLERAFGLRRVIVSTYQAASGAGLAAMQELRESTARRLAGEPVVSPSALPHSLAFNLFPRIDVFRDDGYTREEDKMLLETRRILARPDLAVEATCVRVPVERCHSESVSVELARSATPAAVRTLFGESPGVIVEDDPQASVYPQPDGHTGGDDVAIGRIRESRAFDPGIAFWIVGDQLRKGAALNAVQIAELLNR